MRNLLQKLPFPVEFAVVVAGAFGLTVVTSIMALLNAHPGAASVHTDAGVWRTVGLETAIFLLLGMFLWGRGWKAKHFGLESHWSDGLVGLALAAGSYFIAFLAYNALANVVPAFIEPSEAAPAAAALTPYSVAAIVLVNSLYEEFFVAGYVITALKNKSLPNLAVNASVAIRLLAHLYQGTMGVVLIIPIGLVFGIWYAHTKRLWPLIVAHALLNLMSLAPMMKW